MSKRKATAESQNVPKVKINARTARVLRSLTQDVLTMAVNMSRPEVVREVLRMQNHDLNIAEGGKLLWSAVRKGEREIARMLVQAGAYLHQRMEIKALSLLHFLATKNYPDDNDFIVLLMDYGADVNAINEDGLSVLDWAVYAGKTVMIRELLRRGAEVTHNTLTMVVGSKKVGELLPLLIDHVDLETRNIRAICAFTHLIMQENINFEVVRMMLNLGVPLNQRIEFGYTVLQAAVSKENVDLVKLLLDHGADINTTTINGFYPLTIAVSLRKASITKLLIEKGASIHAESTLSGSYPIHIACSTLSTENIKLLLNLGADVTVTNKLGRTPLSVMNIEDNSLDQSVTLVVKRIALIVSQAGKVHQDDLAIIKGVPVLRTIFNVCLSELERMKESVIYGDISLFSIVSYSMEKLSMLARNDDFVNNYRENCRERKGRFLFYILEMETRFEMARMRRDIVISTDHFVHSSLRKYCLPSVILRKIAYYVCLDEVQCLERNYYLSLDK